MVCITCWLFPIFGMLWLVIIRPIMSIFYKKQIDNVGNVDYDKNNKNDENKEDNEFVLQNHDKRD